MRKVKKGDTVVIMAGKDKGKQGTVLNVSAEDRVLVEGANMVKKHIRPNPNKGITGGIIDQEASLHISNVAILNSITGKPDRVGFKVLEDGRKVRFFKSNGEIVDI